jgi:hypothetical protein
LRLQLCIFFSLGREQLASQDGHVLISLNAIEQRKRSSGINTSDIVCSLGLQKNRG